MKGFPDKGKSYKFPEEYSDLPNTKDIHVLRWLDLIISKKKKERRLLVVTDWEFYLFKSKRFSSTLQIATKFTWLDIIKLSCTTPDESTIEFKDENTIFEVQNNSKQTTHSKNPSITIYLKNSKMYLKFYSYIYSYSLPSEYPEFDYPSGLTSQINKINKRNVISHVYMRLKSNGYIMTKTIQSAIQRFLTKQSIELKLNKLKILQESLPYFCECIDWFPFVKKIIVPFQAFTETDKTVSSDTNHIQTDPISILQIFLPNNTSIDEISFIGQPPYNFSTLVNSIVRSHKKMTTVSFKKCDLDTLHCRSVAEWISNGTIEYLYLISSLSPIVVNSFVQNLQNNTGADKLKKFVIYEAPGIDIVPLLSYLPHIRYISLAYCDFEISEFLYTINNMPTPSLIETAILSGNRNGRRIQPKQKYPPYLRELNLSDINWEPDSFRNIFITFIAHKPKQNPDKYVKNKIIFDSNNFSKDFDDGGFDSEDDDVDFESDEPLIKLDMSNAKMKDESWKEFFKYVQTIKTSQRLGTIRWRSNHLHKVFFLFLEKCSNLRSITLDGCFPSGDNLLPLFVAYLSETKQNIKRLSCAGTTRRWLGPDGSKIIIQCLSSNRTIQHVNLRNNRSGRQMFIDLAQILNRNRFVESIQIDGNDVSTLVTYQNFFTSLRERGKPLKVDWPEQEMNDILQYGTADKNLVEKVRKIYLDVISGTFDADIIVDKKNKKKNKKKENSSDSNYSSSALKVEDDGDAMINDADEL